MEEQSLNRKEVTDYLVYLDEIITPKMPASDQAKYLALKEKLNTRLAQLDKEAPCLNR